MYLFKTHMLHLYYLRTSGMTERLSRRTSILGKECCPRRFKSCQERAVVSLRNFTLITQYWLVPGTDSGMFLQALSFINNRTKLNSV
jgi:hypothetical protein